jgi:autoinducer 2 (AI-2) kinase
MAVAMGGADTQCALLGAGAVAAGDACAVVGTTAPLQAVFASDVRDAAGGLWSGRHVVPERFVLESNAGAMGESLEWIARVLNPDSAEPVGQLLGEARDAPVGSRGMLSGIGVELMNARQPGIPVGHVAAAPMALAGEGFPRAHFSRSVVEGLACGLRANLEQITQARPIPELRFMLAGGLSRSDSFAQRLADVLQQPVRLAATPETTALGAALCAATGAGAFSGLVDAARALAPPRAEVAPDPEAREAHESLWQAWSGWREARQPADAQAAGRAAPFLLATPDASDAAAATRKTRMLVSASMDASGLERLAELGEVEYASFREAMRLLTGNTLVDALGDREVFITEVDIVDAAVLARLPALRVVAACRGDAVNVDIDACTSFGIPVLNAPGRNAEAVADLTLAFALMLARKLAPATAFLHGPDVAAGDMAKMGQAFSAFQGHELWRKSVGLVGLGAVGRKVAARLQPFGARVLVADPFVDSEQAARVGATLVPLELLLQQSDFVSLHAAVTDDTRGLLGAAELARMKPGAFLINTARAALVDETALLAVLESGALGGAALDAFALEPPGPDHPLLAHEGVIATPHVGGNTVEVAAHQGEIIAADLERMLRGERPHHVRNPETLEGFSWEQPRPTPSPAELEALRAKPGPAVSDLQRDQQAPATGPVADAHPAPTLVPQADPGAVDAARRGMTRVLECFVARVREDEGIRSFAATRDVTLAFHLIDVDLKFYIRLSSHVEAAVGEPASTAGVQLRMPARILDGMLLGTLNPMQAAMAGDISFSGDAAKAMTIQELQDDLQRVYHAGRDEAGDPGSLELDARPSPPTPVGDDELREQVCAAVRELYEMQVVTATGGNVSVRIPDRDELWITPSQLFKGDLSPDVLVRVDLDAQPVDPGARSPSSESAMHCAVLTARPDANAVVHAHAPHATTLANAGLPFTPISTEAAFFGNIPRVPFLMPGTGELSKAVAEAMREEWACLMVNHGLVVAGRTLRRACDMVEIIERSAQLILGCRAVGVEPPALPADVVKQLRAMGDLIA